MTVLELDTRIRSMGLELLVDGYGLLIPLELPDRLARLATILQTGLRAKILKRAWIGVDDAISSGRALALNQRIPRGLTLFVTAGDPRWDRIPPKVAVEYPEIFSK